MKWMWSVSQHHHHRHRQSSLPLPAAATAAAAASVTLAFRLAASTQPITSAMALGAIPSCAALPLPPPLPLEEDGTAALNDDSNEPLGPNFWYKQKRESKHR